jgi:glycosyltransferase involved in cell wall biosynthesis
LFIKKGNFSSFLRFLSWIHFEILLLLKNKKNISRPDVVIVSSLSLLSVLSGAYFSWKYDAKFIFEVRDIWPLSLIELGGFNKFNPVVIFLAFIEKFGYTKADAIVGTMPNLKQHVEKIIGDTTKCFTIPQGYSPDFYLNQSNLDSGYIEKYIPKDNFIIMYAGTISRNNPIEVLLKSAKKLKNEKISFVIVGDGNTKKYLQNKYKDLKNIIFAPVISQNKVNHLLSFADVCFDSFSGNLSKYGLSRNKWIDYMYAGKPIICSYSGFESMINESDSGSFVEFNNVSKLTLEILKYKNFTKLELETKGINAHNFIKKNRSFKVLADKYLNIINL